MINSVKRILLQSTFFIRMFRFIKKRLEGKAINISKLQGVNLTQLKKSYTKDGYVTVKSFFTKEQCDLLLSMLSDKHHNYDELVNDGEFKGVSSDKNFSQHNKRAVYWYYFSDKWDDISKIVKNEKLHQLCEYLISSKTKNILYWIKQVDGDLAKCAKSLTNKKYRAGSVGLNAIRVLVYLNDINKEEGGPLYYVKETHLKKPLFAAVYNLFLQKFCNKKAEPILGDAGDVIFVDANGYHKAGRLESGLRSTLQIVYVSEVANYLNRIFNYTTYVKEAKNEGAVS